MCTRSGADAGGGVGICWWVQSTCPRAHGGDCNIVSPIFWFSIEVRIKSCMPFTDDVNELEFDVQSKLMRLPRYLLALGAIQRVFGCRKQYLFCARFFWPTDCSYSLSNPYLVFRSSSSVSVLILCGHGCWIFNALLCSDWSCVDSRAIVCRARKRVEVTFRKMRLLTFFPYRIGSLVVCMKFVGAWSKRFLESSYIYKHIYMCVYVQILPYGAEEDIVRVCRSMFSQRILRDLQSLEAMSSLRYDE